jgi:hypothetical protein
MLDRFILAATFAPLIVPASLNVPDPSESTGVIIMVATMLVFAVAGFALCWKFTARSAKE